MTKLPDHPQSQAEYQHLQQTCDVISREIGKLEAETGVGAEEKRVVSVPQDATMDEIVALDIFRMKLDTLHQLGLAAHQAYFARLDFTADGRPLQLSQTEQRLLRLLVENRGHTLPRETLLDRIWTDGAEYVDENALSVTVGRLRRKLGKNAPIKTVYGVGYTWAVEP